MTAPNIPKYHIIVNESHDGGYSGQCLEVAGAISDGETIDELLKNIMEAIDLVQESIVERAKANQERIIDLPIEVH
ncbi:MAG: type II toxin-antitoxin system HicB family antitoxin [Candidatus Nitrosopolaris wilkensis]|nr:MAG: type II toxin-antitoxin system HicB family antitoxin [Candidatus Nitrosopolaris wilkensis]